MHREVTPIDEVKEELKKKELHSFLKQPGNKRLQSPPHIVRTI